MALGSKSTTHVRSEVGRGMSRSTTTTLPYATKRRSVIPMSGEDSVAEFKRDRGNVRPYVRSSTHKLKWTRELHQSFMRAVTRLGGKHKATPKRIVQHMDKDGITIAHVKSHLQMYRTGKINAEGLPYTETFSADGQECKSISEQMASQHSAGLSQKEARDVHLALQLLKEGRISGAPGAGTALLKSLADIQAFQRLKTSESEKKKDNIIKTHDFVPGVELNDAEYRPPNYVRSSAPRYKSFLDETTRVIDTNIVVNVTDSLSGRKRKAEEEIELDLTMATRSSSSPKIQFPCPSTPEEATLSLGLSS